MLNCLLFLIYWFFNFSSATFDHYSSGLHSLMVNILGADWKWPTSFGLLPFDKSFFGLPLAFKSSSLFDLLLRYWHIFKVLFNLLIMNYSYKTLLSKDYNGETFLGLVPGTAKFKWSTFTDTLMFFGIHFRCWLKMIYIFWSTSLSLVFFMTTFNI